MEKRTILIAGATGSIGGGAALALAKRGAKLVLLGRKPESLANRVDSIRKTLKEEQIDYQDGDITTLVVDFTDLESVKQAADEARIRFPKIDGLVLSVGQLAQKGPTVLPNGHELMFMTSVIGPFLFTQLLLKKIQHSRGIVLQVIAPFYADIDWNDLESLKNHRTNLAYNRAKTCERIFIAELARRNAGTMTSVAFNPSFVIDKTNTELKKKWPKGFYGLLWKVYAMFSKPPAVAGEPIADLMLSDLHGRLINGAVYKLKKHIRKPDKAMNDMEAGSLLWNILMHQTGLASEEA